MKRLFFVVLAALVACSDGSVSGPEKPETQPVDPISQLPLAEQTIYKYMLAYMQATTSAEVWSNFDSALKAVKDAYASEGRLAAYVYSVDAYNRARAKAGWTAFLRSEALLVGHVVSSTNPTPSYYMANSLAGAQYIRVVFTNGINTSMDAAIVDLVELEYLVKELNLPFEVRFVLNYNASSRYVASSDACLYESVQSGESQAVSKCGVPNDLLESSRQVANLLGLITAPIEPDAQRLVDYVRSERAKGIPVILVGHSQGTLFNAQVFKSLGKYDGCVSGLELASPVGRASFGAWASDPGIIVGDSHSTDIIGALGLNDFPRIETNVSRTAWSEKQKLSQLAVSYAAIQMMMLDVSLHSFLKSYFGASESREAIKSMLAPIFDRMNKYANCLGPSGSRLYVVSGNAQFGISGPSSLWIVPPYSYGQDTLIGRIKTASGEEPMFTDIAQSPVDQSFWGISDTKLYRLSTNPPLATPAGNLSGFGTPNALAFDWMGRLFVAGTNGGIMAIDVSQMRSVWSGYLGNYGSAGDMDFSSDGKLYAVMRTNSSDQLATIDVSVSGNVTGTGAATPVSSNALGCENVWGLKFVGPSLYGVTANGNESAVVSIDSRTGSCSVLRKLGFEAFGAGKWKGH